MIRYLQQRKLLTALILYFVLAIGLYRFFQLDIFIPCLYHTFTGLECWGCGTTRAGMALLELDFPSAWKLNPLIYFIAPAFLSFLIFDFIQFQKTQKPNANPIRNP